MALAPSSSEDMLWLHNPGLLFVLTNDGDELGVRGRGGEEPRPAGRVCSATARHLSGARGPGTGLALQKCEPLASVTRGAILVLRMVASTPTTDPVWGRTDVARFVTADASAPLSPCNAAAPLKVSRDLAGQQNQTRVLS
jgi:hypothetical protein